MSVFHQIIIVAAVILAVLYVWAEIRLRRAKRALNAEKARQVRALRQAVELQQRALNAKFGSSDYWTQVFTKILVDHRLETSGPFVPTLPLL